MSAPPMLRFDAASGSMKDMGMAWAQFMGLTGASPGYKSLEDYGRAPADEAWVFSCVRRRYTAAMSVPLTVYVKDGERRVSAEQSSNSAAKDLQALLDDVNPVDMNAGDLKAYLEAGLAVWGEGYIKKVRGRLGGPPQELYWLRAPDVKPSPEQGPQPIAGYVHQPTGIAQATTYPAKDVIAYRTVNLRDPRRGLSPLEAVRNEMRVNMGASENTASTLENWGVPPGAWVAPKGADISPQDQRLITRALKALKGPRNQGKTPVLPEGLDWKPLSLNPKDAEWLAARKVSRMTICAALGVPLVLAGDDDKNTVYGNLRDAERIFWRGTMIPELDWIADGLNSWLVPDFTTKRDIVIAFDYSQIESLRAAPAEEMAQWLEAVKLGLPLNRFIGKFGMGDPVDGGERPNIPDPNAAPPAAADKPKPRAAEYDTARAAAASLGRGLYKNETVKAYLATGDPTVLESLVPEDEVERFALGLQRRLPAAKLIEAWEPVEAPPAPPPAPPQPPTVNVKVENRAPDDEQVAALKAIRDESEERFRIFQAEMKAQADAQLAALAAVTEALKVASERPRREVQTVHRDERGKIVSIVKEEAD